MAGGRGIAFNLHEDIAPDEEDNINVLTQNLLQTHASLIAETPSIDDYLEVSINRHRFPHIVCFDQTRFKFPEVEAKKFYHASWVEGYWSKQAYLLATAPHDVNSTRDFWHMAITVRPMAIVMMDDTPAHKRTAFVDKFWPGTARTCEFPREQGRIKWLKVLNKELLNQAADGSYEKYKFTLMRYAGRESHFSETIVYLMRKDDSPVPAYIPQLRSELRRLHMSLFGRGKNHKLQRNELAPEDIVLLVCGDGVTKNGNFCVFDICMERAIANNRIGLKQTVEIVRRQRYGTVSTFDQYRQLHAMLLPHVSDLVQVGG